MSIFALQLWVILFYNKHLFASEKGENVLADHLTRELTEAFLDKVLYGRDRRLRYGGNLGSDEVSGGLRASRLFWGDYSGGTYYGRISYVKCIILL